MAVVRAERFPFRKGADDFMETSLSSRFEECHHRRERGSFRVTNFLVTDSSVTNFLWGRREP
jgi:hypothetical protein